MYCQTTLPGFEHLFDLPREKRIILLPRYARLQCERLMQRARILQCPRIERVNPLKIWLRDCGRCVICDGRIDLAFPCNHPAALTFDHARSYARGGHHVSANVICAHRVCNIEKGDMTLQEMLIGEIRLRDKHRAGDPVIHHFHEQLSPGMARLVASLGVNPDAGASMMYIENDATKIDHKLRTYWNRSNLVKRGFIDRRLQTHFNWYGPRGAIDRLLPQLRDPSLA